MIEGESNTYYVVRGGHRLLIHQTPWKRDDDAVAGLIELSIDLPDDVQIIDRDTAGLRGCAENTQEKRGR